jgi:hypothetical protein
VPRKSGRLGGLAGSVVEYVIGGWGETKDRRGEATCLISEILDITDDILASESRNSR